MLFRSHEVSSILQGSLRLSVSLHESMSRASSLTSTVKAYMILSPSAARLYLLVAEISLLIRIEIDIELAQLMAGGERVVARGLEGIGRNHDLVHDAL